MPDLKQLKALKKLMQEEGLLKQVQDLAKKNRLDSSIAKNLEEILPIKRQAEDLPVSSLGIIPGPRQRVTRAVQDARRARKLESGSEFRPVLSEDVENYPTSDIDLNARVRNDLLWAAGKEQPKPGFSRFYEDESVSPSRRKHEEDFLNDKQRLEPEDYAETHDDYDYYDRKIHTQDLNDKWDQIKSLLKDKKSSK